MERLTGERVKDLDQSVFVHAKLTTLDKTKFEGYLVGGVHFFVLLYFMKEKSLSLT